MRIKDWLQGIRVYQWAKNFLIFVPMLTAHQYFNWELGARSLLAFFSFSLCTSHHYLLNDVLDLESDRRHHRKMNRPVALGLISVRQALSGSALLIIASFGLGAFLPANFMFALVGYVLLSICYTSVFKKMAFLDVAVLAALYTSRIYAGCAATGIQASKWLSIASIFIFAGLAMLKRYSELHSSGKITDSVPNARGYRNSDQNLIFWAGLASSLLSVFVFGLYIQSPTALSLYLHHSRLWFICPVAIFWVGRTWRLAAGRTFDEDLVLFVLKDPMTYVLLVLVAAVAFSAII